MKNEELKKKICKIIAPYVSTWGEDERIADALIAAHIGDVSGLKNHRLIAEYSLIPEDGNSYVLPNTPLRLKQLYSGEEVERIAKERDEYKHRAEVAGREAIILSRWLADKTRKDYPYQAWLEAAQKQAEKELAEEGKDD